MGHIAEAFIHQNGVQLDQPVADVRPFSCFLELPQDVPNLLGELLCIVSLITVFFVDFALMG